MTKRQFTFLVEVKEGKNLLQKRSWYCHQLLQLMSTVSIFFFILIKIVWYSNVYLNLYREILQLHTTDYYSILCHFNILELWNG